MAPSSQRPETEFVIGAGVICRDGALGELARLVVDPVGAVLTHLVVEAPHRRGTGHLVPLALAGVAADGEIRLACTRSDVAVMDDAEEISFRPGADLSWAHEPSQMLAQPYDPSIVGGCGAGMQSVPEAVIHDHVPTGEVEVRRDGHVHATDGLIGHVQGLVVNSGDHRVTHVLLQEGHLWGKRRVAIPIGAVTRIEDGIHLRLDKREIEGLPSVPHRRSPDGR